MLHRYSKGADLRDIWWLVKPLLILAVQVLDELVECLPIEALFGRFGKARHLRVVVRNTFRGSGQRCLATLLLGSFALHECVLPWGALLHYLFNIVAHLRFELRIVAHLSRLVPSTVHLVKQLR